MSTLLLLRHGQAAFGADHYDQLSPMGHAQAEATGRFIADRGWSFDTVLCGPRQRQQATAAGVLAQLPAAGGVPLRTLTALDEFADSAALLAVARERAGGITLAGSERMRHYMATVQAWADGRVEIAQVPSAQAFQREAGEWLQGLMADGRAGQRVLAVTSAGTISALVCAVLGLPPSRMADFMSGIHNAALTEIVFNRERCSLRHFNGAGHLDTGLLTLM